VTPERASRPRLGGGWAAAGVAPFRGPGQGNDPNSAHRRPRSRIPSHSKQHQPGLFASDGSTARRSRLEPCL